MLADVFIVRFGAMINHKQFQSDSSTPSLPKFTIKFKMGITIGNNPKNRISYKKKTMSDGPSANLKPLFKSSVTKVSVIKRSQN